MIGDEFTGIFTDGKIGTINGIPWEEVDTFTDAQRYFAVGDIVTYPETGREFKVTFVDVNTVRMIVISEPFV
jgi:hypothetical protein